MFTIKHRVTDEMKQAMKAQDKERLGYIRNLHAALRKKEIDDRIEVTDDAALKIILTSIKQRQDSITQFQAANRGDLVAKESAELAFLESFLPEPCSDDVLQGWIDEAMQTHTAMSPIIKEVMLKAIGRADGKRVTEMVRKKLGL